MPVTVISTNTFVSGTAYTPLASGDDLYVLPNVTLMSTGTNAVATNISNVTLHIDGTLTGFTRAVSFEVGSNFGHLYIGEMGTVRAFVSSSNDAGVVLFGTESGITNHGVITVPEAICIYVGNTQGDIFNTGLITGATGIQLAGGSDARVVNYGTITGSNQFDGEIDNFEGRGIVVQSTNAYVLNGATGIIGSTATGGGALLATGNSGGLVFDNFGDVWSAGGIGIDLSAVSFGQSQIRVTNHGTISGQNGAFVGSVNSDLLVNRGDISGSVSTGDGADTFDNRSGAVSGTVETGVGNDTLDNRGGSIDGNWFGGDGDDLYLGALDSSVAGNIDGGFGNDVIAGGYNIDQLYGGAGNDRLVGHDGDNSLFGSTGNDVMYGQVGHDYMDGGDGFDNMLGGYGDDTMLGGTTFDALNGEDGNDRLQGGGGGDVQTGGQGSDTFVFIDITDSSFAVAGDRDRIMDFQVGVDRLDLSQIDANSGLAGNQTFTFIGAAAFGGVAGQVRYVAATGLVSADVNGDGVADFAFSLMNLPAALTAADFIL